MGEAYKFGLCQAWFPGEGTGKIWCSWCMLVVPGKLGLGDLPGRIVQLFSPRERENAQENGLEM